MIPDEAVEAAAKALYVTERGPWVSGGGLVTGGTPWGTSREASERDDYERRARAALEAAAPHLMAEAWDEGYDRAETDHYETGFWTTRLRANPHRKGSEA